MVAYLELVFRNQAGYLVVISVIDPRPDLTAGEVEAAMDTIMGQNIFTSPGGDLVAKVEARLVEREYVWYNIS
ncbi:MAG TPA: DUF2922 domain-containing protein [Desulfotomaculum sp.]|nr:MAG: hypothetical protein JL56_16200 [Desulfotomaculum sp. BICA1-6]HBX22201.1 DUF2922 domain-containing protein [Desulfotomaculum sp.]